MKELHSRILTLTVVSGLLWFTGNAYSQDSEQPEFPKITHQPEDQAVEVGSDVTFTAETENTDGYQWMRNGVAIPGATNKTLTIKKAGKDDVGSYTLFATKDSESVPTRGAVLNVMSGLGGGGPIYIFGMPVVSGGSSGSCPGAYIGYVSYVKPMPAWGWLPTSGATVHTVTDTNRTDTKVLYVGRWGDSGCAQTTVTVPHPTYSLKYRFNVYFTNDVPTNAYAIMLEGFDP